MRVALASLNTRSPARSFDSQRERWRPSGKVVCTHGVFFNTSDRIICLCLSQSGNADWSLAVLMPVLDPEFKFIGIDTFDRFGFRANLYLKFVGGNGSGVVRRRLPTLGLRLFLGIFIH